MGIQDDVFDIRAELEEKSTPEVVQAFDEFTEWAWKQEYDLGTARGILIDIGRGIMSLKKIEKMMKDG